MIKRTLSILIAAGLVLPIVGVVSVQQLQAQADPLTTETVLAQRGDGPDGFGPGGPGGPGGRGDRAERLFEELNLTEDQISQIRAIREGEREEIQALHENLWAEQEVMHDLMAGDASEAELRAQHEKIRSLHQEVADKRFENMLAVRQILTPEQRTELGELMEQRREDRRDYRGEYGGFRGHRGGLRGSDRP